MCMSSNYCLKAEFGVDCFCLQIPGLDLGLHGSKYDWRYLTVNDGRANQANYNGSSVWPRGKMLGGSSSMNAMFYVKGNDYDYQQWYDAGNEHWHPDVVRKYFKKAESYQYCPLLKYPSVNKEYGHKGPQVVNRFNSTIKDVLENVIDAWDEIGIKRVLDLNAANNLGSGIAASSAANGIRQDSARAYLYPIRDRDNLIILTNTLVTKVLIDSSKRAYGVNVERNGKSMTFYARLEVILSAGAINTPQLLMLSGLGPKEHLISKNIPCKADLPFVGRNLQDHCMVPVSICTNDVLNGPDEAVQHFDKIQYLFDRTGSLAENSIVSVQAYYSRNAIYPEFQSHLRVIPTNTSQLLIRNLISSVMRYKDPFLEAVVRLNKKHTLFEFGVTVLHPYSKGKILLASKNPKDHPLIYANYFKDPRDLKNTVIAIKILTQIVNTEYFKSKAATLGSVWPECDKFKMDSDAYWECICLNTGTTVYHPVGTAKMGRDYKTSVVDSRLRVHGVMALRVIDASIMPTITSGNTNAPVTMIGERGADLVKEHYSKF